MNSTPIESIKKEIIIEASQETAFKVFTGKIDLWWPKTHHIGSAPMTELILEPGVGGRWYSTHEDGTEANVGKVLQWSPYGLLVLAWQIDGNFKYSPELITEVEVQFIPQGEKTTRVVMEHKNLDKLSGGSKVVESMDMGWGQIMELYKQVAEKS